MSNLSSNPSQEPGTSAVSSTQPNKLSRPGWLEVITSLVVWAAFTFGISALLKQLGLDPVVYGLSFNALSAIAALGGFAVAALLRVRSWSAFGVRRISWRWLLGGLGVGLLAWVFSRLVIAAYVVITGNTADVQDVYASGAGGGTLSVVLTIVFVAVSTPIGEELLFRGVITRALLRYGPFVGVVGSAVIFALVHGINPAIITALVVGLINAELLRRSGSVWPGVIVHAVNNVLGFGIPLLLVSMG